MRNYKKIVALAAVFVLYALNAITLASPAGEKYSLMATKKFPNASGSAVISDTRIDVDAAGLKPGSVYTVWFVNMKPKKQEAGAGQAPFMFKTDANGHGTYSSPLKASPHGSWHMLMIAEHPNGDPKDMKHMVGALSTEIE
jgi:hypothetical protein